MPASRLGEALDQGERLRFEEDHAQVRTLGAQRFDDLRQLRETCAAARVDGDGDAGLAFARKILDERGQQRQRQVVDAVIADVREHGDGDALAGPGQAGDEDDLHST